MVYVFYILVHPLEDGNGQACINLVSSLLDEAGHERIYFRPFLDLQAAQAEGERLTGLEAKKKS